MQVASVDDEPTVKPSPTGQAFFDHTTHGFASTSALKEPLAQVEQELSVVVLPAVNPSAALHVVTVTAPHPFAFVPAFHVDPTMHALHTPFAEAVARVKPLPAVHVVKVTAPHPFAFVPAFHVDPATQLVQTPLLVLVAGVRPLPVVHVLIVTAAHGLPFVPAL